MFSFLKNLFHTEKKPSQAATFTYKGYDITPMPKKGAGGYRVEALIEKKQGDDTLRHHFIRADQCAVLDECMQLIERKTKLVIDQLGDDIFR